MSTISTDQSSNDSVTLDFSSYKLGTIESGVTIDNGSDSGSAILSPNSPGSAGNPVLFNNGTVSTVYIGVQFNKQASIIHNGRTGSIFGGNTGVFIGNGSTYLSNDGDIGGNIYGIQYQGVGGSIVNNGTISANGIAVYFKSSGAANGLFNSGTITAAQVAVQSDGGGAIVTNSGTMTGDVNLTGGADVVKNSGAITGAVSLSSLDDRLVNSGKITGGVFTGDGDDRFYNDNGAVQGDVRMGSSTTGDLFRNRHGSVEGYVQFGGG